MPRRKLENSTIEVILLDHDRHLGEKFDIVRVKPIFARNILFPQGRAVPADPVNRNNFSQKMAAAAKEKSEKRKTLENFFVQFDEQSPFVITAKVNDEGTLYAKISAESLTRALLDQHADAPLADHNFKLKKTITTPGSYSVIYNYQDKSFTLPLRVDAENAPKSAETPAEKVSETPNEKVEEKVEETSAE